MTFTDTFTVTTPANPYLACDSCGAQVTGWPMTPGPLVNLPCEHQGGYHDLCPSWGPVDGCRCDPQGHPDVRPDNKER